MSITGCGEVKFGCDCFVLSGRALYELRFWCKMQIDAKLTTICKLLSYIIMVYIILPQMKKFLPLCKKLFTKIANSDIINLN